MEESYSISISGVSELIQKLETATNPENSISALDYAVKSTIIPWIKKEKLSKRGPDTLGVVTNRLRSSISSSKPTREDTGFRILIGTNVEYAAYHEFGFRGMVHVPGHTRRIFERTSFKRWVAKPGSMIAEEKRLTRKRVGGYSYVKPYGYLVNYRGRPFLRPAIENPQNQQDLVNQLVKRINQLLRSEGQQ